MFQNIENVALELMKKKKDQPLTSDKSTYGTFYNLFVKQYFFVAS